MATSLKEHLDNIGVEFSDIIKESYEFLERMKYYEKQNGKNSN